MGFLNMYAAMAATGQLEWWKSALQKIIKWNEDQVSLRQKLDFNDQGRTVTLGDLFKRVASYALFNQNPPIVVLDDEKPVQHHHRLFDLFEIYDPDSRQYLKINKEQYRVVAGTLNDEDLGKLLTPANLANNMCILERGNHAMRARERQARGEYFEVGSDF